MLNIFNKINVPKRYFIKLISSFLSIVLILTVIPVAILADMTSGNFNYIESDGKVIITKYLGPAGNVSIPATINEKQVVGIGDYCFYNSFGVTGITFNSSITRIGTWAFGYCSGLTDLSIPAGVVSIGDSAFQNCSNLTSISIPESVNSIGSSVFWNCGNLQNILINENNLFYSSESGVIYNKDKSTVISCIQSKLGSVIIPSSVSIIENYAYYNCSGITEIALTSNIVSIGDSAFENCYLLNNITIPSSVATVGNRAFKHCNSFTEIYIPDSVINLGE